MKIMQGYIDRFGPVFGPKLYELARSRAAHKGVSTRRRREIEELIGRRFRDRRPVEAREEHLPLFPEPATAGA